MSVQLSSPNELLRQDLYHHVAVARGSQLVCMAGQVAVDAENRPVATDLGGQVAAALGNVLTGLTSVGAGATNIVRLTVFVVDWNPDKIDEFQGALARAQAELGLPSPLPPLTVIGVQALYVPEIRVEIEVIAVID